MTSKQLTKVTGTLTAGSDYNTLPEKLRLYILFKIQYGTVFDDINHIHGVSGQEQVSPPHTPGNMLPSCGTEDYLQRKVKVERTNQLGFRFR